MTATATVDTWSEANRQQLLAAVAGVRGALERHLGGEPSHDHPTPDSTEAGGGNGLAGSALDVVTQAFGLSPFERSVLVLAAAVELDSALGALCGAARGESGWSEPTFGLALAALDEPHWSALAPTSPLRRWELVHVTGSSLTTSSMRIDERVLHHLVGIGGLCGGLDGMLVAAPRPPELPPSQRLAAERLVDHWRVDGSAGPAANLVGRTSRAKIAVAANAAATLDAGLLLLDGRWLPPDTRELDRLARLIEREVVLTGSAVLVDADDLDEPEQLHRAAMLVQRVVAPVVLSTRERLPLRDRGSVVIPIDRPTSGEQWRLWSAHVEDHAIVDRLVGQFDLDAQLIDAIGASSEAASLGWWEACRGQARPRLGSLAARVESAATWADLVLPDAPLELLRQLLLDVRHRFAVYERWGMRRGRARGLGTTALFTGPSGTGKTLAAEVLAAELELDLYRIDLASVVSKYIGETEKNLRQVFDGAESGGAVLLFDEADALFGKRTEVRDSHDRYANTEIAYLLQRLEEHRGLAILTTNMRDALDGAFLRRLRFVIEFPFPDAIQREVMWRQAFPAETPTRDLDAAQLAELNVTGGSIRNIATAAAFLAAESGGPVEMNHVERATRVECAKLDLPMGRSFAGSRR
jgi:hypothetical protein